jgi:hypothetical protein
MFGTPKPTASLTSGLLARKGHARPAMRPQGFVSLSPSLEDLGWNDMGDEPVRGPQPVPVDLSAPVAAPTPPVLHQRAALDEQFGDSVPHIPAPEAPTLFAPEAPKPPIRIVRETPAPKAKTAFTLRLDHDRHLRLRLATAVRNQSAQQLVTEALDAFLDTLTEVDALARRLDEGRD